MAQGLLTMMEVKGTLDRLISILEDASIPQDPNQYKSNVLGRAQVCHITSFS